MVSVSTRTTVSECYQPSNLHNLEGQFSLMIFYSLIMAIIEFLVYIGLLTHGHPFSSAIPLCTLSTYCAILLIGVKLCEKKDKKFKIVRLYNVNNWKFTFYRCSMFCTFCALLEH